jgi:DNA-binding LacI/PurR family transcriptional regulator
MRQIGEGTVQLLLRILANGEQAEPPESVTLPHALVVRASTAPPPRSSASSDARRPLD